MDMFLLGVVILLLPNYAVYFIIPVMLYHVVVSDEKKPWDYWAVHCLPVTVASIVGYFLPYVMGVVFILGATIPPLFQKSK